MPRRPKSTTRSPTPSLPSASPSTSTGKRRRTSDDDGKTSPPLAGTKLHILQTKLSPTDIAALFVLAEKSGAELVSRAEDAEVIITAVHMRARLERHLRWDVAASKALVTPTWLHDSMAARKALPCADYAAIRDLKEETAANCPDGKCGSCGGCTGAGDAKKRKLNDDQETDSDPGESSEEPVPSRKKRPSTGTASTAASTPSYKSIYACTRTSPLTCPNQALVDALDVMRKGRALEGEERSALSYARAIGGLKSYPYAITNTKQVQDLPYVGAKIGSMIAEFLRTGLIAEAQQMASSPRHATLSAFASIHGIGPTTARALYGAGLRSFGEVERYYERLGGDIDGYGASHGYRDRDNADGPTRRSKHNNPRMGITKGKEGAMPLAGVLQMVRLRDELRVPIPREEVEEIARLCAAELERIVPGCRHVVCGSHRRGKPTSSDVDIIFAGPERGKDRGLCGLLVERLSAKGIITHTLHHAVGVERGPLKKGHWDSLEKALVVLRLPPSSSSSSTTFSSTSNENEPELFTTSTSSSTSAPRLHRRVDLIFAPFDAFWTAVVGWTGSTMFERDLRIWSKEKKGIKFDSSGMTRLRDGKGIFPDSERGVFDALGLPWIEPEMRNADA